MELGNSTATIERPCLVRQLDAGFLSILDDASQPEIVPVRAFASRIPFVSSPPAALPTHKTDVAPWRLTGFATAEPGSTEASRTPARAANARGPSGTYRPDVTCEVT
jgi:hypothetical protein